MDPTEDFEQQLLISTSIITSTLARCMHAAGLIDEQTITTFRSELDLVWEKARIVPNNAGLAAHLAILASNFLVGGSERQSKSTAAS
jgi:hypothetical protein